MYQSLVFLTPFSCVYIINYDFIVTKQQSRQKIGWRFQEFQIVRPFSYTMKAVQFDTLSWL